MRHILTISLLMLSYVVQGQVIDNTLSYKNINSDQYFRFNYDNDFFAATDKYYTQGIHLEFVGPWVRKVPLVRLLVHPRFGYTRYGIGAEHNAYTPTSISRDDILYGDRPFAAALFLKTFVIAIDAQRRQRFTAQLSTGIIGPGAGGMEMQRGIHAALNNITPHGWQHQIHNDIVLNYQVNYEKQLLEYGRFFSLDAGGTARLGTLSAKAGAGFTLMFGYFDTPFDARQAIGKNFRIYAYERPQVNIIGYDAALQGGLVNRSSPYTISAGSINRITLENRFGFVVVYRRVYLEYFQAYVSREIETGSYHAWGGVQVGIGL